MLSEWVILISVVATAAGGAAVEAAKPAPAGGKDARPAVKQPASRPAAKPRAPARPPAAVKKAAPAAKRPTSRPASPPAAAFTVPARRAHARPADSASQYKLPPQLWRRAVAAATQPAATSQPAMSRPPAQAMQDLQLSGADVQFEIIGDKLILRGPASDLEQLQTFIDEVGRDLPRPEITTVPLPLNVSAEEVAPIVEDIFNRIASPTARPEDAVNVVAEPRSNSLILGVVADRRDAVMKVIDMIVNAPVMPEETSVQWIELKHISPDEAKQLLLQYLSTMQRGSRGAAGQQAIEERIKIEPVPRFNQLMVSAAPEDLKRVMTLLKEVIDVPPAEGASADMLMIRLENTAAEDLVAVLEEIIQAGKAAGAGSAGARDLRAALSEQIRRLRVITTTANPEAALPELDLEKPIRLVAEPNTNSVLIGSTEDNLKAMEEVVRLLDSVPIAPSVQVRIFMLNNADAENVVTLLKTLFDEGKALPLKPGERPAELTRAVPEGPEGTALVHQVGLAADTRTNAVIVSGKAESISLAETVVMQLDREGMNLKHPMHLISVEHASAADLVTTIQELLTERETLTQKQGENAAAMEKVFITADVRSNSILISAKKDNYEEILELVRKLDAAKDIMGEIRIVTLKKTQASDIAQKIQQLWEQRAQMISGGKSTSRELPVIVADARSNALVIASNKSDYESIKTLVEKLEAQPLSPIADIRIIKLENNEAATVGPMLQQLMQERMQQRLAEGQTEQPADRVAIATDAANNLLLVASSKENYALLAKLAGSLDASPLADRKVEVVLLQHADATQLSETVTKLFTAGLQRSEGISPESPVKTALEKVSIVPDIRANALLVSANQANFTIVEGLIKQLDVKGVGLDHPIHIVTVENAGATDLVNTLQQLLTEREQRAQRLGQTAADLEAVFLAADARSNSIIISAKEDNYKEIRELIVKLDGAPDRMGEVRIITLDRTQASELADKIQQMWQTRTQQLSQGAQGGKRDQPVIFADTRSNALVIASSKSDFQAIEKLVKQLEEQPLSAAADIRVIKLNNNDAATVGPMLKQLFDERMQQRLAKGQTEQPADRVAISADSANNLLLVACSKENYALLARLVQDLDVSPMVDRKVEVVVLRHADATQLSETVTSLFTAGLQRSEGLTPESPVKTALEKVSVVADIRANALIVSAGKTNFAIIEGLIKQLDVKGVGLDHPIHIIAVENASAANLVTTIQELLTERQQRAQRLGQTAADLEAVFVAPDVRSNSIIVSAKEDNYEEIAELVKKLDNAPGRMGEIRIITLEKTQAVDLADKIGQMWQKRIQQLSQGAQGGKQDQPVIFADARSNALVIASSKSDFDAIEKLVKQLEVQPLSPAADIRVIKLDHNDAATVGPLLQQLFEQRLQQRLAKGQEEQPSDRVTISADSGSNLLLVACSAENYALIKKLVEPLDTEPELQGAVRTFMLENADAAQLAQTLQDLFSGGVVTKNPLATEGPLGQAMTKVTIVPDTRANAVIVSASQEYLELTARLIQEIDGVGVPRIYENMKLIHVQHSDALRLQGMLDDLFNRSGGGGGQNVDIRTQVVADNRTNTLILWGSRAGVARAEELIHKLDIEDPTATSTFVVYPLKNGSAQRLGPMLQDLFENRQQSGGGGQGTRTPISILPDDGSNSLVVAASLEDHRTLETLLAKIDKPSSFATQMHFIPLAKAKAEPLAATLTDLLQERMRAQGGGGGGGGGSSISVAAEARTNAIIVWATPSDFKEISSIVEQLDNITPDRKVEMRLFRLRNSLAEDLAKMLVEHLKAAGTGTTITNVEGGGGGGGGGGDEQAVLIRLQVENPVTGKLEERTLLRQDITVTPDAKSNTLMVTAPADSIDMLESLIRTLDEIDPLTARIQVFVLRNSSAEEMKTQLEELFQVGEFRPTDNRQRQVLALGGTGGIAVTGGPGVEGIVTGKDEITFTTDVRTNAVIAAGTESQLRVVAEMIEQLDSIEIEDRINRVITVKYNQAPLIQDAIGSFIDAEVQRLERAGENQAVQRLVEREVTVVAQEETNRLLLSVSPRYESQVMEMIRQLDQPPPMVMIDLLLVEVSINEDLEFGMEFALQDLLFSEKASVNPNGVLQGSNFDFVGGTDVGASGSGALGGFSFTITGEDFNYLLRTLKSESRLEVLSNPSIMAQDGTEANITVGENVPFVRNVNVLDTGQVQSNVEYEDIGIVLNVTPHINPDGFVNMELAPEVSQITDSNVTITEGFTAPIFSKRSAETQVTIKDGETVVIGGLITTQTDERETKVPIIGDLPGIGALFRATSTSQRRSELLLIITPHVMRGADDARDLSERILAEDTPSIDENLRDNPLFERLHRKPGGQTRGVPIDLMQGSEDGSTPGAGAAPRKPAAGDEDVYAPSPDVYGPPRPVNVTIDPAHDGIGARMVGPENYEQYLKQRR